MQPAAGAAELPGWGAHGRDLPVGGGPDLPHDHQARVQPQTDGKPCATGGWVQGRVLAQALLQVERREHGAPGMILLGQRCPKDGHDLFTHHRLEGPPIALHRLPRQGIEGAQRVVVRLDLSWRPRRGLGQGTAQYRDELPLPGRRGGAALERRLLDTGIRYWSAVSRARCPLGGGT